jgi:hypothetical protein
MVIKGCLVGKGGVWVMDLCFWLLSSDFRGCYAHKSMWVGGLLVRYGE